MIDHEPLFNLASVESISVTSKNSMISHLMNNKKAVFDYDSRKLSHFKIDTQIESIEEKQILAPQTNELETHLIDNESFKKYYIRIPRFRPEFVLDLRQKR